MRNLLLPALFAFLVTAAQAEEAASPAKATLTALPVTGIASLTFSQSIRQLYLSTPQAVVVLDDRGREINRLAADAPSSVVLAPALRRGFIVTAGGLTVFDPGRSIAIAHLPVPLEHPDQAVFEPRTTALFIAGQNGARNQLAAIDAGGLRDVGTLDLPEKPASILADGAGHLFLTLPASDEILVVDARRREIESHWPVGAACHQPGPAALDEIHHRLYFACGNGQLVAMDSDYGAVETSLPASSSLDALVYDQSADRLYAADTAGPVLVAGTGKDGKLAILDALAVGMPTAFLAFDGRDQHLYLIGKTDTGEGLVTLATDTTP
jgi:hypothetical protein